MFLLNCAIKGKYWWNQIRLPIHVSSLKNPASIETHRNLDNTFFQLDNFCIFNHLCFVWRLQLSYCTGGWWLALDLSGIGGWAKSWGNHNLGFAHSDAGPTLYWGDRTPFCVVSLPDPRITQSKSKFQKGRNCLKLGSFYCHTPIVWTS